MSKDRQGPSIRRVATGQADNGLSVIISDETVGPIESPLMPGARFYSVWGADSMPTLPNDGAEPAFRTWFPPDGDTASSLSRSRQTACLLRRGSTRQLPWPRPKSYCPA